MGLKLKHPNAEGVPLVKIYGPKIKFDRGPALAFNVFDWKDEKVEPVLVQKLADRGNISLSYRFLHHIWFAEKYAEEMGRVLQTKEGRGEGVTTNKKKDKDKDKLGVTMVTAALSFLANFEDAYKLRAFVARFLDADFVEKERWIDTQLLIRKQLRFNSINFIYSYGMWSAKTQKCEFGRGFQVYFLGNWKADDLCNHLSDDFTNYIGNSLVKYISFPFT